MPRLVAFCSFMGLDVLNGWMLWTDNLPKVGPSGLILAHGLCSALIAWVLLSLLPHRYQMPRVSGGFLLFAVAFFIPLIGAMGLTIVLLPAITWPRRERVSDLTIWQYAAEPTLPQSCSTLDLDLSAREAWIASVLQHSADADKRLMAVLATIRLPNRDAIPLLRLSLRDTEDDVRLLAYTLLDRKEIAISHRIENHEQQLENAVAKRKAVLHQSIAQDCWELVQLELAQGEIEIQLIKKAHEHIKAALTDIPNNAGLHFLRGQIFLHQGNTDAAVMDFYQAEQLGIDRGQILPYLAEIHFKHRDFTQLHDQLKGWVHPHIAMLTPTDLIPSNFEMPDRIQPHTA